MLIDYLCDRSNIIGLFFFQAEDGIRDATVTGVQTCALPIWSHPAERRWAARPARWPTAPDAHHGAHRPDRPRQTPARPTAHPAPSVTILAHDRWARPTARPIPHHTTTWADTNVLGNDMLRQERGVVFLPDSERSGESGLRERFYRNFVPPAT